MTAALSGAVVHTSDERSEPSAGPDGLQAERWAGLAAAVLRDEGVAHGEMGLRFVDPGTMAELNLSHMGSPGPTDVLAFPIDGRSGRVHLPEQVPLLGDVVVCPAYAAAQAPDHAGDGHAGDGHVGDGHAGDGHAGDGHEGSLGHAGDGHDGSLGPAGDGHDGSLGDELALLVVHGVLHVLGYDHQSDTDATAMQARERQLLAAHHRHP